MGEPPVVFDIVFLIGGLAGFGLFGLSVFAAERL